LELEVELEVDNSVSEDQGCGTANGAPCGSKSVLELVNNLVPDVRGEFSFDWKGHIEPRKR